MSGKPAIDLKFYLKLFWTTFTLSLFTFGGGFVIVSLMRKKMVDQYGWINDEEMMDFITIAQSSPGPIAVNASLMVGYHLAGIPGALISTLGTILPPMIILTFVSIGYQAVAENTWIKAAFHGMRAVVAAIVLQVTWALFKSLAEKKNILPLVLFAAAFVALFVFKVNIMVVMVAMILLSVVLSIHETKRRTCHESAPSTVLSFFQIGLFSIGGGYAAMPLIQAQTVEIHKWLTPLEFADLVTIAEMTPGPIAINSATFVGMRVAGISVLVATFGNVLPSVIIMLIFAKLYERYSEQTLMKHVLEGVRPTVVAAIFTAGLSLLNLAVGSISALDLFALAVFVAAFLFANSKKITLSPITLLLFGALGGIGWEALGF